MLLYVPAEADNHASSFPAPLVRSNHLTRELQDELRSCGLHATLMREDPRRTSWVPRNPKARAVFWLYLPKRSGFSDRFWKNFDCFTAFARSRNVEITPPVVPVS